MTANGGRGFVHPGGTVLEGVGGVYRVLLEDGAVVEASLRGRVKRTGRRGERIVPGDRVRLASHEDREAFTVEETFPRKNALQRAGPGGRRPKIVAANVDRALVVLSAVEPPFRAETADRFLALAETCGIPPVMVLNKTDLEGAREIIEEASDLYGSIGYSVIAASAQTGEGMERLAEELVDSVSVVIGPSGVGKSTILNALDPDLELRTAPVSRRAGGGRHTTVSARLLPLSCGGWVVDTPGFSDVALWGVAPRDLASGFPEMGEPGERCRFRECSHVHEPECGVREAVEAGTIPASRYESYRTLFEEAREAEDARRRK